MGTNTFPNVGSGGAGVSDTKAFLTSSAGGTTLDLGYGSVQAFDLLLSTNTAITFVNAPAGTNIFAFSLIVTNDGTANRSMSFTNVIKWAGGLLPPKTTTANAVDVWTFFTKDGGVTWFGSLAIIDAKTV